MDWFLYDRVLLHERVNDLYVTSFSMKALNSKLACVCRSRTVKNKVNKMDFF